MWIQPEDPRGPWIFEEIGVGYRQATNIQVADVNGDGSTDLIATQGHHVGLLWFEGPMWKPHYVDRTLRSPHSLAVADLDGDGDTDFATCAYESRVLAWFSNDGQGSFPRRQATRRSGWPTPPSQKPAIVGAWPGRWRRASKT